MQVPGKIFKRWKHSPSCWRCRCLEKYSKYGNIPYPGAWKNSKNRDVGAWKNLKYSKYVKTSKYYVEFFQYDFPLTIRIPAC
jgi:hypothetical protein